MPAPKPKKESELSVPAHCEGLAA